MPRITVRLDQPLYDRLLLYARGRQQECPEISEIVREALERYLQQQSQRPVRHIAPQEQKE